MKSILRIAGLLTVLATTGLLSQTAFAQTWNYKFYGKNAVYPGTVTLEKSGDGYQFRWINTAAGSRNDTCYRSAVDATVEQTPDTITITPKMPMADCPHPRYVIKTDGSGGHTEFIGKDGTWKVEPHDHLLTLKK